jgi:hypothetical protein
MPHWQLSAANGEIELGFRSRRKLEMHARTVPFFRFMAIPD